MVSETLTVVLRAQQDLSERNFYHVLDKLRAAPTTSVPSNPRSTPLQLGPFDVVGVYSLKPPPPVLSEQLTDTDGSSPRPPRPLSVWERSKKLLSGFTSAASAAMKRISFRLFLFSCIRWGWTVPSRMLDWIGCMEAITSSVAESEIYDPQQWILEAMCVANGQQGQGVGRAIMKHIQAELTRNHSAGMRGLCQSERTMNFYVKCGFKSREVYTHPKPSPLKPGAALCSFPACDAVHYALRGHSDL
jgi:GNAT superfamily N-acetyltransferase